MQDPTTHAQLTAPAKSRRSPKSTKTQKVLTLLRRHKGATIVELSKATQWQDHSVRGFLSGTVKRRMGLDVLSEKDAKGVRRYRIIEPEGA